MQGIQPRPHRSPIRRTLEAVRRRLLLFVPALLIMPFLAGLTAVPANAVFNGVNPDPSQFGFVVKLLTTYPNNQHEACTGSLISSDIVVTDAHCVDSHDNGIAASVAVTFHAGQPGAYTVTAQSYPNLNYAINSPTRADDIAFLVLNNSVNEPTIPLASTEPPVGAQVVQAGYGCPDDPLAKKQPDCYVNLAPSWQLKDMASTVGTDGLCAQYLDKASQICTFSQRSSTNSGDSGGPVIWLDNGVWKLVGLNEGHITSKVPSVPQAKYRMESTSIAYELNWLQARIANIPPKPVATAHLYWTTFGTGTITKANLDGMGVSTLATGQNGPYGVAVDNTHIYWATYSDGTIRRANLDGTGATTLATGQNSPYGVAVNGRYIYWNNLGDGTINRANLDGTGLTTVVVTDQSIGYGVAADSSHIYWTTSGVGGTINRANLDGTGVTTLVTSQNGPYGLAVDSSHIYWTVLGDGTIGEANLDGTGVTFPAGGQNRPYVVAVDGSHLYWTSLDDGTINRANLDGSGATPLVYTQSPGFLAVGQ
ncbi:trypsin-like serine protease [Pseudarthrobacter sp. efr-133-R2A-89]|uniref:trypsin-like serine protease n=1 Tax=Pseudarthrobacter sp. efr-133-R2A-89 TaxID=3040302 RepID=UPI002556DBB1|nr:trypsin-like serine protease [Pseudarthrobacter sp. efr-133-R2A-89]